jgi:hypothetical protein
MYLVGVVHAQQNIQTLDRRRYCQLKNLAQKQRREDIAAELGRSLSATSVKAHQLGVSLKAPAKVAMNPDKTA